MERNLPTPSPVGYDVDLRYHKPTTRKIITVLTDEITNQRNAYGFFKSQNAAEEYTKHHINDAKYMTVKHAFPGGKKYSHLNVDINRWVIIVDYVDENRMTATGFFETQKKAYSHIKYIMIDLLNSPNHRLYVIQLKPYDGLVN